MHWLLSLLERKGFNPAQAGWFFWSKVMPRPPYERILGPYRFGNQMYNYSILSRSYSGVTTPGYKTLKKLKLLPDNPYTSSVQRCAAGSTFRTLTRDGKQDITSLEVHYTGDTPFDGIFPSLKVDATNKATLKLYKAVDGVKLNTAQFLAERKQTAELLASTATRISNAVRSLRRADLRGFATSLSLSGTETRSLRKSWSNVQRTKPGLRITNHWLEYVYGWRPLLQDCFDAAELLAEQLTTYEGPEGELRTSATVRAPYKLRNSVQPWNEGGVVLPQRDDLHICTARIRVQYRLDSEARSLLNKTGISNPALLAWELLPYSFVVDWFFPIGTYLESLTAMDGFTLTRGTVSTLESAVSDRWLEFANGGYFGPYAYDFAVAERTGPRVSCSQSVYSRTPQTNFPYALRVKSPIGGEPLERFATAMSLLVGLFGRA